MSPRWSIGIGRRIGDEGRMDRATGHVFIAMSLDGFIAREDGGLDWLMKQSTEGEEHGFEAFMDGVDGLVMGSGTFETVVGFDAWPYTKPVVVMSQRLTDEDVPEKLRDKARVSAEKPAALMTAVAGDGGKRVYVDGGAVVGSFLREGLVDDLVITIIPILLGTGRRLFGELSADLDLDLLDSKAFPSGLLRTHYRIRRAEPG
jgi:dihydrofolate reductase